MDSRDVRTYISVDLVSVDLVRVLLKDKERFRVWLLLAFDGYGYKQFLLL